MIGDARGVLKCHLQACRELLQLCQRKSITIDPAVLVFALELYLYTSAVGTTFGYDGRSDQLTFDSEYDLLQSLSCVASGYGFMVGYAGTLFRLLVHLAEAVVSWISQDCDVEPSIADGELRFFQDELQSWVPSYTDSLADKSEQQSVLRRRHNEAKVVAEIKYTIKHS